MNTLTLWGEIKKRQTEVEATDADLMKAAGLSRKQWRSRNANPGSVRLGEAVAICNYLGLNFERRKTW